MEKIDLKGYLEFACYLPEYQIDADNGELLNAADISQIHTFGWPIGVVLHNNDELKPKPISQDKISAIIERPPYSDTTDNTFDYWTLDRQGHYYILKSLFEDTHEGHNIFLDTRTLRTAELLLRTARLYKALEVPEHEEIVCSVEYGGLKGRILTVVSPLRTPLHKRECSINEVSKTFREPISSFLDEERLKEIVFDIVKTITEGCEFYIPSKKVTDDIINKFLKGQIA